MVRVQRMPMPPGAHCAQTSATPARHRDCRWLPTGTWIAIAHLCCDTHPHSPFMTNGVTHVQPAHQHQAMVPSGRGLGITTPPGHAHARACIPSWRERRWRRGEKENSRRRRPTIGQIAHNVRADAPASSLRPESAVRNATATARRSGAGARGIRQAREARLSCAWVSILQLSAPRQTRHASAGVASAARLGRACRSGRVGAGELGGPACRPAQTGARRIDADAGTPRIRPDGATPDQVRSLSRPRPARCGTSASTASPRPNRPDASSG